MVYVNHQGCGRYDEAVEEVGEGHPSVDMMTGSGAVGFGGVLVGGRRAREGVLGALAIPIAVPEVHQPQQPGMLGDVRPAEGVPRLDAEHRRIGHCAEVKDEL